MYKIIIIICLILANSNLQSGIIYTPTKIISNDTNTQEIEYVWIFEDDGKFSIKMKRECSYTSQTQSDDKNWGKFETFTGTPMLTKDEQKNIDIFARVKFEVEGNYFKIIGVANEYEFSLSYLEGEKFKPLRIPEIITEDYKIDISQYGYNILIFNISDGDYTKSFQLER